MAPSELHDVLQRAAITAQLTMATLKDSSDRIEALERELAARPTSWAYDAACKALHHWRDEAARLAKLAGVEPRQMNTEGGSDVWRPIETLPPAGQVLVTDDDLPNEPGEGYGCIELAICPMLADGRILNQNSGNYTRAGTWKWWAPVPPREIAGTSPAVYPNLSF